LEPVRTNIVRSIRFRHLTEVVQSDGLVGQPAPRSVENREVLDGVGVAILEPAVGNPAPVHLPAAADRSDRIQGGPAALFQPIKGKQSLVRGGNIGEFLYLKIVRVLFEFHGCPSRRCVSQTQDSTCVYGREWCPVRQSDSAFSQIRSFSPSTRNSQ